MKNRDKTENIGQTRKNDDAKDENTPDKFQITGGFEKKRDIFVFKKIDHRKFSTFLNKKKAETEMKKKG